MARLELAIRCIPRRNRNLPIISAKNLTLYPAHLRLAIRESNGNPSRKVWRGLKRMGYYILSIFTIINDNKYEAD
jgi:hypothetical protein